MLVAAAAAGLFMLFQHNLQLGGLAKQEAGLQASELAECRKRLGSFFDAYKRYKADHKGAEPQSFDELIPKYVKDPALLFCPTADRWTKAKRARIEQGKLSYKGTDYPVTYGLLWMSPALAPVRKRLGDRAPLIRCEVHREALYRATYGKRPTLNAFGESERRGLIREVSEAPIPGVRGDGEVVLLGPDGY